MLYTQPDSYMTPADVESKVWMAGCTKGEK